MRESGQSRPKSIDTETKSRLDDLRERIDEVDRAIVEKLNERARWVQEVGRLKATGGVPVYEAAREREIVERLREANPGPFPDEGLAPVFREIISATRSLEQVVRVAYFGPEGTFTHQAASEQFGALAELAPVSTIAEVFSAVERGKADLGVVPVENTTQGVVTQTLDAFVGSDVTICGEALLRVSLCLLSSSGDRARIRRVASHPQPLAQCRLWLDSNLSAIERVETASTAAAAQVAREDPEVAAIASAIAGEAYGLLPIETAIEDRRDNTTRFLVIGRQSPAPSGDDLTSVMFTTRRDEVGALFRLLEPFATHGVNLTCIQQRPLEGKPWEYVFFIDLEGHRDDARVREALDAATQVTHSHRILGSFPRARGVGGAR